METSKKQPVPGPGLHLRGLSKSFGSHQILHDLDLAIPGGVFTVLLGGSGCGKTTCLRLIAGLEHADGGQIMIGDRDVTQLPPAGRGVAMVFQSYALFPHLSAAENITFGLRARGTPKAERDRRLAWAADLLGLTPMLNRKPSQLSGGQQQRVALGRTIVAEAPVCLMDEPLSNLDARLRADMRRELVSLQRRLGLTMICVTHDQMEAMSMADHVVVMNQGRVEQAGPPAAIYERPATQFVAGFLGAPPMNLLPLVPLGGGMGIAGTGRIVLPTSMNRPVVAGIRPEALVPAGQGHHPHLDLVVTHREYLGGDTVLTGSIPGTDVTLQARLTGSVAAAAGESRPMGLPAAALHFFDPETGHRIEPT